MVRPSLFVLCSVAVACVAGCASNPTVRELRDSVPVGSYVSPVNVPTLASCIEASWADQLVVGSARIDTQRDEGAHLVTATLDGKLAFLAEVRPSADLGSEVTLHEHNVVTIGWSGYASSVERCAEGGGALSRR